MRACARRAEQGYRGGRALFVDAQLDVCDLDAVARRPVDDAHDGLRIWVELAQHGPQLYDNSAPHIGVGWALQGVGGWGGGEAPSVGFVAA